MIKKTLEKTKKSTFVVLIPHPNPSFKDFPTPSGTGFFFNSRGYFLTARHVIQKIDPQGKISMNSAGIPELFDVAKITLLRPELDSVYISGLTLVSDFPELDLVILKADFEKHKNQESLKDKTEFPNIDIDFSVISEGEAVYSFGYPLSEYQVQQLPSPSGIMIGTDTYFPRVTSSIISSHYEEIGAILTDSFPKHYIIDKALNYGNSGGPIVVEETGKVISVCTSFKPMTMKNSGIIIPSLYGTTISLKNIQKQIEAL